MKTCLVCGAEIPWTGVGTPARKNCGSRACLLEASRRRYVRDREVNLARSRLYRRRHKKALKLRRAARRVVRMKSCVICGAEFRQLRAAKTCSLKCRRENQRRRKEEYGRRYYALHREKMNDQAQARRVAHPERHREACRRHYWVHHEQMKERGKRRYWEDHEHNRERARLYHRAHQPEISLRTYLKRQNALDIFRENGRRHYRRQSQREKAIVAAMIKAGILPKGAGRTLKARQEICKAARELGVL